MLKGKTKRLLGFLMFLVILILVLLSLSAFGLFTLNHPRGANYLNQFMAQHTVYFAMWRGSLMVLIVYFYPAIVNRLLSAQQVKSNLYPKLIYRCWPIVACGLYELLIVHNSVSVLVNWALQNI